jgi:hypothetical protein
VTFNGRPATFSVVCATYIKATVPTGATSHVGFAFDCRLAIFLSDFLRAFAVAVGTPVCRNPMLRHEEAVPMGKHKVKPNYRRRLLRLPDLDHCKRAVLNSLGSPASRRVYEYAIDQFIAWYCSEPRLAFNRIVVVRYRLHLESPRSGRKYDQPTTRSCSKTRARSRRRRLAQPGTSCRDQPGERCQAAWVSRRQLVEPSAKLRGPATCFWRGHAS